MTFRFILPGLLLVLCCTFTARAEYFSIREYHIEVTFNEDGEALFDETITVEFTQPRHGIYRFIPYQSVVDGKKVKRIFKDINVTGYNFKTSKENKNVVVRIGDADTYVDGRQTYHLHYRVANPLNFFDDHIEFYWDLLGTSWPVTIENITYRIQFPGQVKIERDDVHIYTGKAGSGASEVEAEVYPTAISGSVTRTLQPNEGLTMAVRFDKGVFKEMGFWQSFFLRHSLLLAPLGFLALGIMGVVRARNQRLTIMPEFFPPEDISPAVAGGFVDHSVDNHDVLSLIPHLGNQGYLQLEAREKKGFFKTKSEVSFRKLREGDDKLLPFERKFFNDLFSTGNYVELSDLKNSFYTTMSSVRSSVKAWIHEQGWYASDQKRMGCITAIGGLAAIAWGVLAIFIWQNLDGIALIITGIILLIMTTQFNKRTASGNATFRKLEGFRMFVKKAERPVIERLLKDDPLYYDKTMPFALAFGYLKQWNKQFDGLLKEPPSWYVSPYLHGSDLTNSWNTFSTSFPTEVDQIGSVFNSTPSSSGSGGGFGGGGGFSGGGSGGGGGGSW